MSEPEELQELVTFIANSSRLSLAEARRIVQEVLAYLHETPETFVCRRHHALQTQGLSNAQIYRQVSAEMANRLFAAPAYSERQIRRLIYG
jgi:hypothetical protein